MAYCGGAGTGTGGKSLTYFSTFSQFHILNFRYGYPDPTYLDRVLEDLRNKNVSEETCIYNEHKEFSRCFQKWNTSIFWEVDRQDDTCIWIGSAHPRWILKRVFLFAFTPSSDSFSILYANFFQIGTKLPLIKRILFSFKWRVIPILKGDIL